jgi:hypothetical protein
MGMEPLMNANNEEVLKKKLFTGKSSGNGPSEF